MGIITYAALLIVLALPARAQTFLGSPRQSPEGSWHVTPFYRQSEGQKVAFGVPTTAGTTVDVPGSVDGGWTGLKAAWQPFDRVEYFATAAGGHWALDVASVTVTNSLRGERVGWELGAGAKVNLVPETPATPAASLTFAVSRSQVGFNSMEQAGVKTAQDQRLTLDRAEAALTMSKRFGTVEPYGGLALSRLRAELKDLASGAHNAGTQDRTRAVIGLKANVLEQEGVVVEVRLAGGLSWTVGWDVRF